MQESPVVTQQIRSRHKYKLNTKKSLSRHTNWVATKNIDNTKRPGHNIKMKLQQEIRLSDDKSLSRQTF